MKTIIALCTSLSLISCGDTFEKHVAYPDGPDFGAKLTTSDPDSTATSGYDLCRKISRTARHRGVKDTGWGWTFGILGVASAAAGTIYPLAKSDQPDFGGKVFAASMTAAGVALVVVSRAFFNRSDAASKLASVTASVLGESESGEGGAKPLLISDGAAGAKCNVALGAWEASRADATAIATTLLDKQKADDAKQSAAAEQSKNGLMNNILLKLCPTECTPEQAKGVQDAFRAAHGR